MSATYTIEKNLVRLNLVGETPPEDVTHCFLEMLADPDCPETVALLLDGTRSTSLAARSPEEIRYVARFPGPHAERIGGRCAILVSTGTDLELIRLGAVFSETVGVEARGFCDEAAALEWLRVAPAE